MFIVDNDHQVREAIRSVLEDDGRTAAVYATGEAFLAAYRPRLGACLLIDAYLPGMNGLELLQRPRDAGHRLPAIMITGNSDVPMAVKAMKAGASDFIEKPVSSDDLLASIDRTVEQSRDAGKRLAWRETAANQLAGLTPRQREVMALVLAAIRARASRQISTSASAPSRTTGRRS